MNPIWIIICYINANVKLCKIVVERREKKNNNNDNNNNSSTFYFHPYRWEWNCLPLDAFKLLLCAKYIHVTIFIRATSTTNKTMNALFSAQTKIPGSNVSKIQLFGYANAFAENALVYMDVRTSNSSESIKMSNWIVSNAFPATHLCISPYIYIYVYTHTHILKVWLWNTVSSNVVSIWNFCALWYWITDQKQMYFLFKIVQNGSFNWLNHVYGIVYRNNIPVSNTFILLNFQAKKFHVEIMRRLNYISREDENIPWLSAIKFQFKVTRFYYF